MTSSLIGMGDSAKLPDSGPGSYRFVEHRRYLDALLEDLGVRERVTLVVHGWGSALGFDWANRHREAVRGIAYMEAIVQPRGWNDWPEPTRDLLQRSARRRARSWCWSSPSSSRTWPVASLQEDSPHEIGRAIADWLASINADGSVKER